MNVHGFYTWFKVVLLFAGFTANNASSQDRLILSDGVYIVIDNSAYVVLANGAANAITTMGSGGYIVSEHEFDILRWDIGTNTGVHTIPYMTRPVSQGGNGTEIPLTFNVTTAGVGAGSFDFSTYETSTDMNIPYPVGLPNMNLSATGWDASLYVVDRFWIMDGTGFTTKPGVAVTFGYDNAANEMGGANSITESYLRAKSYKPVGNLWSGLIGQANTTVSSVSNVIIDDASSAPIWVLTDFTKPIQIEESGRTVEKVGISIYPNPSSALLNVRIYGDSRESAKLLIRDLNGRVVSQWPEQRTQSISIDMSNFTPGFYVIEAQIGSETFREKLVIE